MMKYVIFNNIIIVFLFNSFLFSLPIYSVQEATNCMSCHVNPTGGGMRNEYGSNIYALDELPIKRWINKGEEEWDGYITNHIQFGGDFRMQTYNNGDSTKVFPMQADIYTNVKINKKANLYIKADLGKYNHDYFVMFKNMKNNGWIKIGQSMPNYGLKIDDHTSFIRGGNYNTLFPGDNLNYQYDEGLFFKPNIKSPIMIEYGAQLFKNVFANIGISNNLITNKSGMDNYSATISSITKVDDLNILGGFSFLKEISAESMSLYGGFSIEKLTMLFEVDKTKNWIEDFDSFASMMKFVYKPVQGIHLLTKYDFFDRNYNLLDGDLARITFGIEFYLLNMLELDLQFRQYETNNINFSNDIDDEYLMQLHTWF